MRPPDHFRMMAENLCAARCETEQVPCDFHFDQAIREAQAEAFEEAARALCSLCRNDTANNADIHPAEFVNHLWHHEIIWLSGERSLSPCGAHLVRQRAAALRGEKGAADVQGG